MNKLLAQLTQPCRDMARLLSESMDRTLPWLTRVKVQMHLVICQGCREYRTQLRQLRQAMQHDAALSSAGASELSEAARARLKEALQSKHQ